MNNFLLNGSLSTAGQALFVKRLSLLLTAGVPLVESLQLIERQTKHPQQVRLYGAIRDAVASGQLLWVALLPHRRSFSDFTIGLIRIGEESGTLPHTLAHAAQALSAKEALRRKVMSALLYPASISVATIGMTGGLVAYLFPKLMPIFSSLQVTLPPTTRALIALSNFLHTWGGAVTAALIGVVALCIYAKRRYAPVAEMYDAVLLRLPVCGTLVRTYHVAQLCHTLGLLLERSVPTAQALTIVAETTSNTQYRRTLIALHQAVARGSTMGNELRHHGRLFPELCTQLLSVGEETGSLADTCRYLAELYDGEVDQLAKTFASAVEPVLMLSMGLLVGLVAISVITPIYSLTGHMGG